MANLTWTNWAAAAAVVAASVVAAAQTPATVGPVTAFTNVTVVPMDANKVVPNQTVLVTGDRITAVGPAAKIAVPAAATRVEGKGKYLMPGLAEMHGHIPPPTQPKSFIDNVLFLYVANGVTTVRGMQGAPGQLELREAAKRGEIVSPSLYLAGPAFSGGSVKTPEEAVARVRQQKAEGWDLLKVLPGLSRASYDAMARTAKESGIRFGGHVPADVGVLHALESGQDSIDHLDGMAEMLDGRAREIPDAAIKDLVAKVKEAGTWQVPTLVVWETLQGPVTLESRTSLPELKYLPADYVANWTKGLEGRLKKEGYDTSEARRYIDNRMRLFSAMHQAGVRILLGSDAPQQFNVPGFSIHREMRRMADAGMSPYDVVRSGTAAVGEYFKDQDRFGTIAQGQRADLILVDANPLENLANIQKRSGVMVRGRWLTAADIDRRLAEIAAAR